MKVLSAVGVRNQRVSCNGPERPHVLGLLVVRQQRHLTALGESGTNPLFSMRDGDASPFFPKIVVDSMSSGGLEYWNKLFLESALILQGAMRRWTCNWATGILGRPGTPTESRSNWLRSSYRMKLLLPF